MQVRCPICDTENRGIAKFCIECVNPLPTAFAAPGFARTEYAPPPEAPRKSRSTTAFTPIDAPKRSLWFSVGGLVLALTVGTAAGWMLAGPGAVYKTEPGASAVQIAMPIALPAPTAGPTGPVPVEPVAAVKRPSSLSPSSPPSPPSAPSLQEEVAKPVAVLRPNRQHAEAVDPSAACSGLNFFSAARCMAAQCLKPAFKPHPQCEAVRRQQQLEEEKRNPILAN